MICMKRALALAVSFVMTAEMLFAGGTVWAAGKPADDKEATKKLISEYRNWKKDAFRYRTKYEEGMKLDSVGDSTFDLRDVDGKNYVTPVKFQNPFGTCWGFAAIGAAETSVLGNPDLNRDDPDELLKEYSTSKEQKGRTDGKDPEGKDILDFSEKHLVNFFNRPIDDKDDPQYGEGRHYIDDNMPLSDKFDVGGMPFYATGLFSSGMGPNLEGRKLGEPYDSDEKLKEILKYQGLNKEVDKAKVKGSWVDYCYSREDDWSIPSDLRYKQSFVLEESFMLPSPAQFEEDPEDDMNPGIYHYDPRGTEAVKEMLLEKRAVEVGYTADTSMPDRESTTQFISENWAHFTYDPDAQANHAVLIIGWDDDYPKENFSHKIEVEDEDTGEITIQDAPLPEGDGAWLVKNSWGSEEEVFPNKGPGWGLADPDTGLQTGYFWLSYYDRSISMLEALKFDKSNDGKEYYLYQHDYMPVEDVFANEFDEEASMANVFTADQSEYLEQVSCQTAVPDTTVEYKVYILSGKHSTPEDGSCVSSGTREYKYGGYHKITLDEPVPIQKGQSYSVVITEKIEGGRYNVNMPISNGKAWAESGMDNVWCEGVINKGESYLFIGGEWQDYADRKFIREMMGEFDVLMSFDNFPIRAYATKRDDINITVATGETVNLVTKGHLGGANEATMNVRFRGTAELPSDDPEIDWKVADGYEDMIEIEKNPDNSSSCKVRALRAGTAFVEVSSEGIGSRVIRIETAKKGKYLVSYITMEYGESTYVDVYYMDFSDVDLSKITFRSTNEKIVKISKSGKVKTTGVGKVRCYVCDDVGVEEPFSIRVKQAPQSMKVKGKTFEIKKAKLGKDVKVKRTKVITVKNQKGKLTFTKKKGSKDIKISKKTGLVTVKKGLKRGTYKVKVSVKAAGNKLYKAQSKTVTFKIKVK